MSFAKLPERVRLIIALVMLILVVAAIIGTAFLPSPWYAVVQITLYGFLVYGIGLGLRDCFRLARTAHQKSKLRWIVFWIFVSVTGVIGHTGKMIDSDDKDYVQLALPLGIYLGLMTALELIKSLLAAGTPAPDPTPARNP